MKVHEIIDNINKFENNVANVEDDLLEYFKIDDWIDLEQHGFKSYFVNSWICTDTRVGLALCFYKDMPYAFAWKPFRKAYWIFSWIRGESTYKFIRQKIYDIIDKIEELELYEVDMNAKFSLDELKNQESDYVPTWMIKDDKSG